MKTERFINSTLIVYEVGKTRLIHASASSALQIKHWELYQKLIKTEEELKVYRVSFWFLLTMFVLSLLILIGGVICG